MQNFNKYINFTLTKKKHYEYIVTFFYFFYGAQTMYGKKKCAASQNG